MAHVLRMGNSRDIQTLNNRWQQQCKLRVVSERLVVTKLGYSIYCRSSEFIFLAVAAPGPCVTTYCEAMQLFEAKHTSISQFGFPVFWRLHSLSAELGSATFSHLCTWCREITSVLFISEQKILCLQSRVLPGMFPWVTYFNPHSSCMQFLKGKDPSNFHSHRSDFNHLNERFPSKRNIKALLDRCSLRWFL